MTLFPEADSARYVRRSRVSAGVGQFEDPHGSLAKTEHRVGQVLRAGVDAEGASMLFDSGVAQDSLQVVPAVSLEERIDIVVVAGVHDGVATVGEAQVAVFRFGHLDGKRVPVGERELGAEHQRAVRTS